MKKVMVFGTFDLLHKGHLNFFKQAKKHGDYLVVVVARDVNIKRFRGRYPVQNEKIRLRNARKVDIVDKATLGSKTDYTAVIKREKPDVICLGYDQRHNTSRLKGHLEKINIRVPIKRLKPYKPHLYKSSLMKKCLS